MNTERNKYLTEAMGDKYHERGADRHGQIWCTCGLWWHSEHNSSLNTDFSTYEGFGKLIAFLDGEMSDQQIADMLYALAIDGCIQNLPGKAANFTFDFLKSRESEEA